MSITQALATAPPETTLRLNASGSAAPWDGCGGAVGGGIAFAARSRDRTRLLVGEVSAPPAVRRELSGLLPFLLLRETLAAAPLPTVSELLDGTVRRSDPAATFTATVVDGFPDGTVTGCQLASPAPAVAHDSGELAPLMPGTEGVVSGSLGPGELLLVYSVGYLESTPPGTLAAAPRQYRLHHSVDAVWAGLMPLADRRPTTTGAALAVLRCVALVPTG